MTDYAALADSLRSALCLGRPPVAVCLVDHAPAGVAPFEGRVAAGCAFWEIGADRAFFTATEDHEACAIGTFTHNMVGTSPAHERDRRDALKVFADLGYVREADLPLLPTLKRPVAGVAYAPLAQAPAPPDVVLLFVDSRQGLIVAEAAQQVENGTAPALGRPACAIVPQVVETGRAALSLGCCGARAYVNALGDDIALWGLPGKNLEAYVERVAALSQANQLLSRFHELRRADVEAGAAPSIEASLARLEQSRAQ